MSDFFQPLNLLTLTVMLIGPMAAYARLNMISDLIDDDIVFVGLYRPIQCLLYISIIIMI